MPELAVYKLPEDLTSYGVQPERMQAYLAAWQDYVAGQRVLRQLSIAHAVPEPTVRRWAKLNEWAVVAPPAPQSASQRKRKIIDNHFAGLDQIPLTAEPEEIFEHVAATQDIKDMEQGLAICRLAMKRLKIKVKREREPRVIKVILEATKIAVETIRKVRNLDQAPSDPADSYEARLTRLMRDAEQKGLVPPLETPLISG